jgi:hypothetical protein
MASLRIHFSMGRPRTLNVPRCDCGRHTLARCKVRGRSADLYVLEGRRITVAAPKKQIRVPQPRPQLLDVTDRTLFSSRPHYPGSGLE